jgi:NitT/TauT family transport system substrate-binding protein
MKPRRPTRALALGAGLALALAAAGSVGVAATSKATIPTKPESGTFQMGIEPWLGYGPWRIAQKQGYFGKQGITVKITNFATDDQINAALAGKRLDGSNVATHTALRLAEAGLPIKIVLLEDLSTKADAILAGPGINTIKDLRGKKVAYEEGTTSDILLRYALGQNGMTLKDVKPVPIPASDAGAAAIAGRVDAAVTYEPYLTTALKQKKGFKLIYTAGRNPGLIGDVFVVRNDVLKSKPGQVLALVKAWQRSVAYYKANTPKAQNIIEKAVGAKPGDLATAFQGVTLYTVQDNLKQLRGKYLVTIEDVRKAAKAAGLIKGTIKPKGMIVTDFVDAAASSK